MLAWTRQFLMEMLRECGIELGLAFFGFRAG